MEGQHEHEHEAEHEAHATGAGPDAAPQLEPHVAAALNLQRTVGNRAVSRMLARAPGPPPPPNVAGASDAQFVFDMTTMFGGTFGKAPTVQDKPVTPQTKISDFDFADTVELLNAEQRRVSPAPDGKWVDDADSDLIVEGEVSPGVTRTSDLQKGIVVETVSTKEATGWRRYRLGEDGSLTLFDSVVEDENGAITTVKTDAWGQVHTKKVETWSKASLSAEGISFTAPKTTSSLKLAGGTSVEHSHELKMNVILKDDEIGFGLDPSLSAGLKTKDEKASVKAGLGGEWSITASTAPIKGTKNVAVTIKVHLAIKPSLGGNVKGLPIGAKGGYTTSGDFAIKRIMPADKTTELLAKISSCNSLPWVKALKHLDALSIIPSSLMHIDTLWTPREALKLADSESVTLSLESGWSGEAELFYKVGGSTASGRTVQVARVGSVYPNAAILHVGITVSKKGSFQQGVSLPGVGGINDERSWDRFSLVPFRLVTSDPDWEKRFHEIVKLTTEEQAERYWDEHPALRVTRTEGSGSGQGSGVTGSFSVGDHSIEGGLGVKGGSSGSWSYDDEGNVIGGQFDAYSRFSGSVGVDGESFTPYGSDVEASATVGAEGFESFSINKKTTGLSAWAALENRGAIGLLIYSAITKGEVGPAIQAASKMTASDLEGHDLDFADISMLVERAQAEGVWMDIELVPPPSQSWFESSKEAKARKRSWAKLRTDLLNPWCDKEWLANDRTNGKKVAEALGQARHITQYIGKYGVFARENILAVLERWGEDRTSVSTATDLGKRKQWKNSMKEAGKTWNDIKTWVDSEAIAEVGAAKTAGGDAKVAAFNKKADEQLAGLDKLADEIAKSDSLVDNVARVDMVGGIYKVQAKITGLKRDLQNWHSVYQSYLTEGNVSEETGPLASEDAPDQYMSVDEGEQYSEYTDGDVMFTKDWAPDEYMTPNPAQSRLGEMQEHAQVYLDRDNLRDVANALEKTVRFTRREALERLDLAAACTDFGERTRLVSEAAHLHERWRDRVIDLRKAYRDGGVGRKFYAVSYNRGDRDRTELDMKLEDVEKLIRVWRSTFEMHSLANSMPGRKKDVEDSYRKWAEY